MLYKVHLLYMREDNSAKLNLSHYLQEIVFAGKRIERITELSGRNVDRFVNFSTNYAD